MSQWLPSLGAVVATIVVVFAVRSLESRIWAKDASEQRFRKQIWTFAVLFIGMLTVIFVLPQGANQDLAFGAIGLVFTGALAISSQSIIANGMAGLLLRSLGNFKPGDFIEVGDNLGRVTELGLFHTEIQTADRDLTTIPNSLMVNQPVKVVRASGTIVSAMASLGYDVSRHQLEPLFVAAAEASGLAEPFVQVVELADYSVNYRIAGFLEKPQRLLAARSALRGHILDQLNEAGIEIMSPMFVATRPVGATPQIPTDNGTPAAGHWRPSAESRVFDKAELASGIETQRKEAAETETALDELSAQLAITESGAEADAIRQKIEARQRRLGRIATQIKHLEGLLTEE